MSTSRRITAAIDTVGSALSTERFRRRFAAAAPETQQQVEAIARAELEQRGVVLDGLAARFEWEPSKRKLAVTIEPAPLTKV